MSEWKAKRFWKSTSVIPQGAGFTVTLDDRPLRTPAKAPLVVPTRALAEAIAAEWQAQEGEIEPATMPFTRLANSAIDKVAPQHDEVAALLAAYGETDLICHRAAAPPELVRRQAEAWDPMLDWAAQTLGARLVPVAGVIAARQDPEALERLAARTQALGAFELAAFHELVTLTGSLVLGFAALAVVHDSETIWKISRIDEDWQAEHWGQDEEAARQTSLKKQAFFDAMAALALLQGG